jgi:DNA-binding NtrC family response regulator
MPGPLRSPELARKAQERLPTLAVLFTSGYTQNAIVHGGRLDEGVELLSKPYTREALARKIRHVLRSRQQRGDRESSAEASQQTVADDVIGVAERPLRVLLVEDDAIIRLATAEMLIKLGHEVREAGNANKALEILDKQTFDVIVTDLSLPGMRGEELAALALERQPELGVVFATGYGPSAMTGGQSGPRAAVTLQKPYGEDSIAKALRAALSAVRA